MRDERTHLRCVVCAARCRIDHIAADSEAGLALGVLGCERERTSTTLEGEELAVGDLASTVRTATAGEGDNLVASSAAGVEVEAGLGERADDQGGVGLVVVNTLGLCGQERQSDFPAGTR